MSRSAAASIRTRASRRSTARAARKAAGVVAVFTAEDLAATVAPLFATSRMTRLSRHADPAACARQSALCRRAGGRHRGAEPLPCRRRARTDRHRIRAVAGRHDPLEAVKRPARRCCTRRPAATSLSAASSSVATSMPRSRAAPVRVKGRFRMHRKTALAIEPRACLAEYDAGRRALTLHSATQVPGIVRDALATALDISGNDIRVVAADVGGGFGGKGSLYPEEIFVCAAARLLGRSVKWTSDRMEDLTSTSQAFDEIVDAELGLDAEGRDRSRLSADVIGDVGAYSIYPWTAALEPVQVVSFLPGPYRIRALPRPRARRRHLESADRTLSRRRPPDLDLRDGAADGHGRRASWASTQRRSRLRNLVDAGGVSLQGRVRHRLGQIRLQRVSRRRLPARSATTCCAQSRKRRAPPAAGSASASPAMPS